jgi:hypothetical protein
MPDETAGPSHSKRISAVDIERLKRWQKRQTLTRKKLKTPRATAIAGIVFSLLLMASLMLIKLSVPADPAVPGEWLKDPVLSYRS